MGFFELYKGRINGECRNDYCIDATIKSGFEHGFRIIVPAGANTTVDNSYLSASQTVEYYNDFMWNGRYAMCVSLEEAFHMLIIDLKEDDHYL